MKKFFALLAFAFCMSLPLFSLAQPGGDDDVVDVPIDGGLSLLVVAGVSYGAKKLYGSRQLSLDEIQIED
jgi:hypothetical protein